MQRFIRSGFILKISEEFKYITTLEECDNITEHQKKIELNAKVCNREMAIEQINKYFDIVEEKCQQ